MDCTCFKQCPINKEEILWKNGICKSSKSKRCFSGQRALCASACALHLPNPFRVATRNSDAIPRAPQRNVLSGVLRASNLLHLHSLPVKLNALHPFPLRPSPPHPSPEQSTQRIWLGSIEIINSPGLLSFSLLTTGSLSGQ